MSPVVGQSAWEYGEKARIEEASKALEQEPIKLEFLEEALVA